jgi:hypothetical protein
MTAMTTWRTDEPCPVCGAGLFVCDDGSAPVHAECRLCGWSDTWTADQPAPADPCTGEASRAAQWLMTEFELTGQAYADWRARRPLYPDEYQRLQRPRLVRCDQPGSEVRHD